jgi:hypothetical protein
MQDITIYTAINNGGSIRRNDNSRSENCCLVGCTSHIVSYLERLCASNLKHKDLAFRCGKRKRAGRVGMTIFLVHFYSRLL